MVSSIHPEDRLMEPIEVGFMLVIYILPIVGIFAILSLIAEIIERRKQK